MELRSREQVCELWDPNIVVFRWSGVVEPDDVSKLFAEVRGRSAGWAETFVVFDMSRVHLLPGDTRRRFVSELAELPLRATAITRAEFPLRVIATTIMNVVKVEGSKGEFDFFDDEESALKWFATFGKGGPAA